VSARALRLDLDDGQVAGSALGPEADNPDVLFLHATGFNARTYRSMLAPLGEKFSVWATDARGHGRTTLPAKRWGYTSWRQHRDDVIALLERHTSAPVTLAGHSFGATVSLLVAAQRPELVAALALIDPVIMPLGRYAFMELPLVPYIMRGSFPIARNAGRRRAHFPSREAAVEAFTGRGVFKLFAKEMIEDYVADGLIEDDKGGFTLACTPAYESATFAAQRNRVWSKFHRLQCPLVALRAHQGSTFSEAAMHRLAAIKPDARIATVEGAGHMLPMERPDRVRALIESAALLGPARAIF
jgi:pimeloyl-ACP methyl ester carboxylesterase